MTSSVHDASRAINVHLLDPSLWEGMQRAWNIDTCWPGCADNYPQNRDDNPSFGNCFVTVLLAWADRGFRDTIVPGIAHNPATRTDTWHFRLRAHEGKICAIIDPTWQQFSEGAVFEEICPDNPMYGTILKESVFEDDSLRDRLQAMLTWMEELNENYTARYSANEIITVLENRFARYRPPAVSPLPVPAHGIP